MATSGSFLESGVDPRITSGPSTCAQVLGVRDASAAPIANSAAKNLAIRSAGCRIDARLA